LKQNLVAHKFKADRGVEHVCDTMADNTGQDCYRQVTPSFLQQYDKCLICVGEYVTQQWDNSTDKCEQKMVENKDFTVLTK